MTDNTSTQKPTFSHYSITDRAIFKGFTINQNGTFFAKVALPSGQVNGKQSYINVSAIVSDSAALQALASSLCDVAINDGKGTAAEVTLTNMKASNAFDENGNLHCNDQGLPYINYSAFLNRIVFS